MGFYFIWMHQSGHARSAASGRQANLAAHAGRRAQVDSDVRAVREFADFLKSVATRLHELRATICLSRVHVLQPSSLAVLHPGRRGARKLV